MRIKYHSCKANRAGPVQTLKEVSKLIGPICAQNLEIQSTLIISKSKGLSGILPDIRTLTYQICGIEENNKLINHTLLKLRDILKILWKRGEIAPEEQFLLFSTIF